MGASLLSPAKVLLLAAHYAAHADIESLTRLASQRATVLRKELLLRILLTHLPETVKPAAYVGLLQRLADGDLGAHADDDELDTNPVSDLSDEQASKKAKKLHLLQLSCPDASTREHDDPLSAFLFQRSYRMDCETGLLSQLPDLLVPFLHHAPAVRSWVASTVLPYLRKNFEYCAHQVPLHPLLDFQKLPDRAAVAYLLSPAERREEDNGLVGRDLRGLVGPWLQDDARWTPRSSSGEASDIGDASSGVYCPGWEQVLEWLVAQATGSWTVAVAAVEQWGGPQDVELDYGLSSTLTEPQLRYLERSYARAALASAYLVSEATVEALPGAYRIVSKIRSLLGHSQDIHPLEVAASTLPNLSLFDATSFPSVKTATYMRHDLLQVKNPLTSPTPAAMVLLSALILSAFICTRLGVPCTVKRAGDLAFLQDQREQKGELAKLIRAASTHARKDEDAYWVQVRCEILWLHSWGAAEDGAEKAGGVRGVIGIVPRDFIEAEILKALLSKSRYALARSIYEDGMEKPLPAEVIQDIVYHSALNAFDNASNPNRSRGGLKRCDEIIHAFPGTVGKTHPATKRVEALLRCTHALSDYRFVLKQGEPFSPVVLRVHSDPVLIIDKVLEQNPKAYTRLQEFLEMAVNMVHAGISRRSTPGGLDRAPDEDDDAELAVAEKRIVAMCIEAALREDDFETAYSYVVNRLDTSGVGEPGAASHERRDEWSWNAALKAGQYVRTERTLQPTHLGTASGNLEIRHLEQRIECLATALRVAPSSQLQEILKSFRRCEEQLDSSIRQEAANEAAWDTAGEVPGAFDGPNNLDNNNNNNSNNPPRNMTATAAARQAEEAPMSLFDLSRATARVAQQNFTRLSSLPGMAAAAGPLATAPDSSSSSGRGQPEDQAHQHQRTRKRDQLREAATGTLVSGVGWLIGANMNRGAAETMNERITE